MKCKCGESFFCSVTRRRRSAWATPSCLSTSEWTLAAALVAAARGGASAFVSFLYSLARYSREALCQRVLGYPEALVYLQSERWIRETFYPGFMKHQLPQLEKALSSHLAQLEGTP